MPVVMSQIGPESNGVNTIFANQRELGRNTRGTFLLSQVVLISTIKPISSSISNDIAFHITGMWHFTYEFSQRSTKVDKLKLFCLFWIKLVIRIKTPILLTRLFQN